MSELIFKLTKEESQIMLNALTKEPYENVFKLINKIQEQVSEQ